MKAGSPLACSSACTPASCSPSCAACACTPSANCFHFSAESTASCGHPGAGSSRIVLRVRLNAKHTQINRQQTRGPRPALPWSQACCNTSQTGIGRTAVTCRRRSYSVASASLSARRVASSPCTEEVECMAMARSWARRRLEKVRWEADAVCMASRQAKRRWPGNSCCLGQPTMTARTCSCASWPARLACSPSTLLLSAAKAASCSVRDAACSRAPARSAAQGKGSVDRTKFSRGMQAGPCLSKLAAASRCQATPQADAAADCAASQAHLSALRPAPSLLSARQQKPAAQRPSVPERPA